MQFQQFSRNNTYVRKSRQWPEIHFNASLHFLQFRGQSPTNYKKKLGSNLSHTFNKSKDLFPWIEEKLYTKLYFRQVSMNADILGIPRKLQQIHFNGNFTPIYCLKKIHKSTTLLYVRYKHIFSFPQSQTNFMKD